MPPPRHDPLEALNEQLLVLRAQGNDRAAFHDLMALYDRRVAYYARRMLSDPAQALDVTQEIWLRVYRRLPTLRSPAAFRVWLYRIAHDLVVTHCRRRPREESRDDLDGLSEGDVGNEFELLERAELVHHGLAQLTAEQREVLTLRFLEGLEPAEIASVVQCPAGTVRSRLHYALRAIRRLIEGDHHAGS